MKKMIFLFVIVLMLAVVACGDGELVVTGGQPTPTPSPTPQSQSIDEPVRAVEYFDGTIYELLLDNPAVMLQLTPLVVGEELAIIHTNFGDVTVRFFPEEAPLAVENFKTHARNGFYDGLIFHRVIPDFMLQGGCPLGLGIGGESIWGGGFGLERSLNLLHFRGALATAHSGPGGTIGSQFYIVQATQIQDPSFVELFRYITTVQDEIAAEFSDGRHIYVRDLHPAYGMEHFIRHGGTPHLDWHWNEDRFGNRYGHTVFGHVVSGMNVVDEIANVETTPSDYHDTARRNRPLEDVIIENISFIIYNGTESE
ncbi:MAG: peptidylprolyl isomerase [Defluviitaleaceae bacterium]|nr:peptidylprolyl isomerase [Defluviitaleaceae bacterium]